MSRTDVEKARRLIFEAEDVIPDKPGPNGDNITISDRGTSAEYLRRRLKRDAPSLWEDEGKPPQIFVEGSRSELAGGQGSTRKNLVKFLTRVQATTKGAPNTKSPRSSAPIAPT